MIKKNDNKTVGQVAWILSYLGRGGGVTDNIARTLYLEKTHHKKVHFLTTTNFVF